MRKGRKYERNKERTDKEHDTEELKKLQEKIAGMTPEELKQFRNSQDADSMGFYGEE